MSLNRHVFAKISKYPFGGEVMELTDEEIQQYKDGGYVVEEYADGGESKCPEGMVSDGKGGCIEISSLFNEQEEFEKTLPKTEPKYYDKEGNLLETVPDYGTIYVTGEDDPKYKEYQDRLKFYNKAKKLYEEEGSGSGQYRDDYKNKYRYTSQLPTVNWEDAKIASQKKSSWATYWDLGVKGSIHGGYGDNDYIPDAWSDLLSEALKTTARPTKYFRGEGSMKPVFTYPSLNVKVLDEALLKEKSPSTPTTLKAQDPDEIYGEHSFRTGNRVVNGVLKSNPEPEFTPLPTRPLQTTPLVKEPTPGTVKPPASTLKWVYNKKLNKWHQIQRPVKPEDLESRKIGFLQDGGEIMELTDEEIQEYRDGGYVVEKYPDGGTKTPKVKQRRGTRENFDGHSVWTPSGQFSRPSDVSSHLMKAEYVDGRGWVAFPSLFQDSKPYADDSRNWVDMSDEKDGWWPIYEEAERRGEVYDFGEDKEAALAFGKGSWKNQLPTKEDGGEVMELTDKEIKDYKAKGYLVEMADGGGIKEESGYEYKKDGDKYLTRKKGAENWIEASGKALASIKYNIYGEGENPQSPAEKETAIINRMRSTFHARDDEGFWSTEYEKLSPKEQKIHEYSSELKSGDRTHDPKSAEGKAFEAYAKKVASPEAWMKLMPQTMGQVFDPSNDPNKFKSIKKSWGNVTPEDIETTQDRGSSFDGLTDEDVQFATEQKQQMDKIYSDADVISAQNDERSKALHNQQREQAKWDSGVDPVTGKVMSPWEITKQTPEQYYSDLHNSGIKDILDYSGLTTLAELSGVAPVSRVIDNPKKTWEGIKQTGSDIWAAAEVQGRDLFGMDPNMDYMASGNINPNTGKEYWTGVDETFDALAVAGPLVGALGKSKPFLKKGFNLINEVPSTRVLSKTPLQRLDDVGAWNRYLGNDTKGVRSTIAKHTEKAELKLNLMKENRMLNKQWKASDRGDDIAAKYWRKKRADVQWEGNDAIRKKYQNFRLKNSGLPIEHTGKGGGQGRIYKNLLDENEYIKLGRFPGTENQLQSLIDVGHELKKTGNFDNVAFPTKGLTLREGVDFGGNTITTQHMPKLSGSGSYGRGDLEETANLLRQVRTLDRKGVGIDYVGQNNIMFDPASKKYQLVDLNYVGPSSNRASNSWSWNKLNLTPKERLAEKFGGKLLDDAADKIKFEDAILQSPEYKSYLKEQALLNQHKYGGEVMELTDKEIKDYRAKGYTVIID